MTPHRLFSRFVGTDLRVGDLVEVRSLPEILATLDTKGHLDGLAFMPEMTRYAGKRFRVMKVAHKTCDSVGSYGLRRMSDAVHLPTRCDGSGHDGCQAGCLLFWRSAWLKRFDGAGDTPPVPAGTAAAGCDAETLRWATRAQEPGGGVRYHCQATQLESLTTPLSPLDVRQYIRDYLSGNVPLRTIVSTTVMAFLKSSLRLLIGKKGVQALKRLLRPFRGDTVDEPTAGPPGTAVPRARGAQPGNIVCVRPREQIMATLDRKWRNRGLSFDADMLRYSGGRYRVLRRVERIIDEKSGRMLRISKDCLILDGVICTAQCRRDRLFCPRGTYAYWREVWLE